MAAEFVALAELLRAPEARPAAAETPADDRIACEPLAGALAADVETALRDARLFRARLADAFADAVSRLVRDFACEVLVRELQLAPCDLAALVRRAGERAPVVRVRVSACDVAVLAGMPVVADGVLEPGDAIVELAGGAVDARLGVRLATVLEEFA